MERWKSRCPHCGDYHEITWSDIRFEHEEKQVSGKKTYLINTIYYICPGCGAVLVRRHGYRTATPGLDAAGNCARCGANAGIVVR